MARKTNLLLLMAALIIALMPSVNAAEVPKNYLMVSCDTTPDLACIKSITAYVKNLTPVVATKPVSSVVLNDGRSLDTYQEWVFPGIKFEGSSNSRLIPRITFRPFGAEQCNFDVCFTGLEEIQVGVEPSWLITTDEDRRNLLMDLSHRGNQFLCGEKNSPSLCYRGFNFNQDISFEIKMFVPKEFRASAILGDAKNLSFNESGLVVSRNGAEFKEVVTKYQSQKTQRVLFSPQVPNPMATSPYADYESDRSGFWIVGQKSIQSAKLGKCSSVPFITVLSNSIYQDLPVWNSINQTVEVKLTAPHFTVKGDLHKGYFEATISKEMGQCLWGIDLSKQAVAQMSISYPAETGVEVLTISGKFDGKNYNLFSANFHYSSPTIAFKLIQESKPVAVAAVPIKKTISCVKGKATKKVTAEKPKCPKGFKLKV
jgi:hypothetical protein